MDRSDVAELARQLGLGRHADALASVGLESIRLQPFDGAVDEFGTHLGGRPAVPADFDWPIWRDRPLAFVGQFRLAELGRLGADFGLPEAGLLSFFFEAEQQPWGFDPADAGGARVRWFPPAELVVADLPATLVDWARYVARPVRMTTEWTVPSIVAPEIDALTASARQAIDSERFERLREQLAGIEPDQDATIHRLFGYADEIQNEMRLECAFATSGVYVGNPEGYDHPHRAEFKRQALDWQLLLQLDSDELLGTEFGDVGRIYYWITRQAVAERAFDRAWQILQCY